MRETDKMNKIIAADNWACDGQYIKQLTDKAKDKLKELNKAKKIVLWANDYFYKEVSYMNENELKIVACRLPESMNIGIEVDKKCERSIIFDKFLSQYPELSKFKRK